MDAKELAAKFVAKAAAAVAEKDRQQTAKPDDDGKRLEEDVEDCKRAMTEVVIPFMSELKAHFPQDQFSFAPQIDVSDHKFVGVSFRVGDGPITAISTTFGNVLVSHTGASGSSKGVHIVYSQEAEPFISNSGDLTREKISKLVEMIIDHT